MKRIAALVLFAALTLSGCTGADGPAQTGSTPTPQDPAAAESPAPMPAYADPELVRAVELGIGEYKQSDDTVTFRQFLPMLDSTVRIADPSKLPDWQKQLGDARNADEQMTRADGMTAVYCAAETLGPAYCEFNATWDSLHQLIGEHWYDYLPKDHLFPGMADPSMLEPEWTRRASAYFYSFGRVSAFSDRSLFDYDPQTNSMRTDAPLTYTEALLAALRLSDSNLRAADRSPAEEDRRILARADARREAIRSSLTAVSVTGTSYFVSNSGNDKNDGLTPQSAWATVQNVNGRRLKPGDGVFFERGGLWRCQQIKAQKGVTYSAYGEGEKPRFYMSPENGAGSEKWTLVQGAPNIWVFYKPMQDVGAIVFDGGETWATKALHAYAGGASEKLYDYAGGAKVMPEDHSQPFDLAASLRDDLMCYSDDPAQSFGEAINGHPKADVPLYLRCDSGNPGEVFGSIEFLAWGSHILPADDCIFDNLALSYTSSHSIFNYGTKFVVQNCEIGWVGGGVMNYGSDGNPVRFGNGVESDGNYSGFSVSSNYFYQIYDAAMTNQDVDPNDEYESLSQNIVYSGNLIEYSTYGLEWLYAVGGKNDHGMKDVLVEDNMILYSGYGFGSSRPDKNTTASLKAWGNMKNAVQNVAVTNNVFYISTGALVDCALFSPAVLGGRQEAIAFEGNTFVQNDYGIVIASGDGRTYHQNAGAAHIVADVLGDPSGVLLPPDQAAVTTP